MKTAYSRARLSDIALLNPTLIDRPAPDESVSFVPMAAVSAETARVGQVVDRPYLEVSKGYTPFLSGDVLIAKITPCFENGKIAQALLPRKHGFGSTEFHVVRPHEGRADARYLLHYLRLGRIRSEGERRMTGSGGQRRVPADFLAQLEVPLPPLPEQRRIAAILDQAESLRSQRRAAVAQLDSFTQSIFADMFGDPVENPKQWERATLGDAIHSASDGPHVSPRYADEGVPFLSARHVRITGIDWKDLKYISRDDALVHWRKCKPEVGDVLYTKGGTTGIAAVVPDAKPFAIWVHVALLKVRKERVSPKWLEAMLNSGYCFAQSQALTFGIANRDLGLKRMVRVQIFLPPLALQQTFATRIQAIEALKAAHGAALAELDALFASLQQRAFSGQL